MKRESKEDKSIIVIAWNDSELTYLKHFKYPEEREESSEAFNKVLATKDESHLMTREAFFDKFLKSEKLPIGVEVSNSFKATCDWCEGELYLNGITSEKIIEEIKEEGWKEKEGKLYCQYCNG